MIDIACIQETWLSAESNVTTSIIKEAGYNITHMFRSNKRGAGVAILWKDKINSFKLDCQVKPKSYSSLQYKCLVFKFNPKITIINIYRLQEVPLTQFLTDLDELINDHFNFSHSLILTGDFNVHFEKSDSQETILLSDLASSFGLSQLVEGQTHKRGHTLDLLFLNKFEMSVTTSPPLNFDIGDHFPVRFNFNNLQNCTPSSSSQVASYRNIKGINLVEFSSDICSQLDNVSFTEDFQASYKEFSNITNNTLDRHAPLITKKLVGKNNIPWQDSEYRNERALRRKLERKWKKSGTRDGPERILYTEQRKKCANLATSKRSQFYRSLIQKNEGDQSSLFQIVSKVLDKQKSSGILPQFGNQPEHLANQFNQFYTDKVRKIRDKIPAIDSSVTTDYNGAAFTGVPIDIFEPTSVSELREIVKGSSIKTAYNDVLPSKVLKNVLDDLLPYICNLINLSFSTGSMDGVKEATIFPLLKKMGLDPEILKNYRPVSDIVYISKLAEKVVSRRLNIHVIENNLQCNFQYGYKRYHSTETLLLKVVNDTLVGFNSKSATILLLLDLSAAFDTVDLQKLLNILEHEFGIKNTALKWFKSYLTGRTQRVRINGSISESVDVLYGVPQGSVLGPILFNIYIRSLYSVIDAAGFSTSGYADDSNAKQTFPICFQYDIITQQLPKLMDQITNWMNSFFLKINPDKTEIILFTPKVLKDRPTINGTIFSTGTCIRFSDVVQNLGVKLDRLLSFESHIDSTVAHCFKLLKDVSSIRNLISKEDTEMLVHSIISSRLDYCNSLFYNLKKSTLNKLQKVQNAAARVVLKLKKHVSVRSELFNLHWLRIEERIIFKLLVTTFKCLNDMAPVELSALLHVNNVEACTLQYVFMDSIYGRRSFQYIAPRIWNQLPMAIRKINTIENFKSKIKFLLFNDFDEFMRSVNKYL